MNVQNHRHGEPNADALRRMAALLPGQKMQDLPVDLWHASFKKYVLESPYRGGGPNLRLIRLREDEPSLTVTGYIFNKFVHPTEDRYITVREAARLQGFPDRVEFVGGIGSTRLQVGNAVPPALASSILHSVARALGISENSPGEALSLFSGAGGFDLGAREVPGLAVLAASDNWLDAVTTLRGWAGGEFRVDHLDVHSITDPVGYWKSAAPNSQSPDIIYGGPPCQSFSQAGKQRGDTDDRGALVFEFLRMVQTLKPRAFVLENVANIRGIAKGKLLRRILDSVAEIGYAAEWRILHAVEHGAPQRRKRFFLVGTTGEVDPSECWPTPTFGPHSLGAKPFLTVGEAFQGLPKSQLDVRPSVRRPGF